MPQIKPYQQQVATPDAFNTGSRNPSIEGGPARALQTAAGAVQDVGRVMYEIQQNKDVSDASKRLAELRLNYTQRVVKDSESGSLDLEKLDADFESELEKISGNYSTRGGTDFAKRTGMEIKNSIRQSAFAAQSELTKVKLTEDREQQLGIFSQLLAVDPSQREAVIKQYDNYLNNLSMNGRPLDEKIKQKFRNEDLKKLEVAQIRGLYTNATTEQLPGLLDAMNKGALLGRNFDSDTLKQLKSEVKSEISWRNAEEERKKRVAEDADKKRIEAIMSKVYDRLDQDALSYDDVKKDPEIKSLPFEKREQIKNMLVRDNKRELAANSAYFSTRYFSDILDGKLTSATELEQAYIDNKIDKQSMVFLASQLDYTKTPEGRRVMTLGKPMFGQAESLLTKKMFGISDPEGEKQFDLYKKDVMALIRKKISEGVPPESLFDQKSKDSLWPFVNNYVKSMSEKVGTQTKYLNPQKTEAPKFKSIDEYEKSKGSNK